jgi:hypothetical protein
MDQASFTDAEADELFDIFVDENFDYCDPLTACLSMDALCIQFTTWLVARYSSSIFMPNFKRIVERHGLPIRLTPMPACANAEDDCDLPNEQDDENLLVLGLMPKPQDASQCTA